MDIPLPRRPLNPRQERFCHYFVLYASASVAAHEAGYSGKSSKHQGYRLLRTDRVRDRIRAIHAEHASDLGGNTDALIGKLEAVYRRAIQNHHFHTAARCVELQARLAAMKNRKEPLPALPALPPAPIKTPLQASGKSAAEIFAEAANVAEAAKSVG
ncbi:MAG TPA: terminase small subunit [Rhodospirillales bacterium]|jgi:hypothetical protein|nr:terminase small subunit [Rhodospirillales bacterium]